MQEPLLIEDMAVATIGTRYAIFRIEKPRANAAMERSIRQYGQMHPVVCVRYSEGIEMLDGFKRLRAYQRLGKTSLSAWALAEMPAHACKVALVKLNQPGNFITDLEEAMVINSLCCDNELNQSEIAVLFGQDKSWVSRRLSLVEKHQKTVLNSIMSGLVPMVSGRALARLPCDNQEAVLACVIKHRLTIRETAKLVSYLLSRPRWDHQTILASPWEVLGRE